MKILAIDTSQIQASLCMIQDGSVRASLSGSTSVSHSESLLALVDKLLKDSDTTLAQIDAFACGVGPGSFTGIRIGCATIKALAQVMNKPVYAFSSLKALALSVEGAEESKSHAALVNAYQGQVFVGWINSDGKWQEDAMQEAQWREQHFKNQTLAAVGTFINPQGIASAIRGAKPITYLQLQAQYLRPSQAEIKLAQTAQTQIK